MSIPAGADPRRLDWDGSYDDDPAYGSGIRKRGEVEDFENVPGMSVVELAGPRPMTEAELAEAQAVNMMFLDRDEEVTQELILAMFKSKAARGQYGRPLARTYYSLDAEEQAADVEAFRATYGVNLLSLLEALEKEFGLDELIKNPEDKARELSRRAKAARKTRKPAQRKPSKAQKAPGRKI